jgi:hypothetical protein
MPTKREREYYAMGFRDGVAQGRETPRDIPLYPPLPTRRRTTPSGGFETLVELPSRKPKRKLSAWNKYVKANSKKPRFRYRNGKLNLKKMAVAFRKTPAGRKKKRR